MCAAAPSTTASAPTGWCSTSIRAGGRLRRGQGAAPEVRKRLRRVKLTSFVKTTGGKGLHVVAPIKPDAVGDRQGLSATARALHGEGRPPALPRQPRKSRRHGRIFVDYLRNSREATAIAPYSTRARQGAPVAVPVAWSERAIRAGNQYTVKNLAQRLSEAGGATQGRHWRQPAGAAEIQMKRPAMWRAFCIASDDVRRQRSC